MRDYLSSRYLGGKRFGEAGGVAVESVATWPGGARSIDFRLPDENLAELITAGSWKID